jgi:hypothetical protein
MDKVVKFLKDKKKRNILIGTLLVVVLLIILFGCNRLTSLEEKTIKDVSKKVMPYMDRIENSKEKDKLGKYVYYAVEYAYNEQDKKEVTVDEVKKIISDTFNYKIDDKKVKELPLTSEMMENYITYNFEKEVFFNDKADLTQSDIANKKLVFYEVSKITKKANDKFKVTYDKYVVTNPYEILNYYSDLNSKNEGKKKAKTYDTTPIFNYLTCKGKEKDIKNYVIGANFDKFAKKKGKFIVNYIVKEDKILIDSYESVK